MPEITVDSCYIHPLKSARARAVDAFEMTPRGPEGDRLWMVVDAATGKFVTQRENAKLATVTAAPAGDGLTLSADGMDAIDVARPAARRRDVTVWKDDCRALDAGDDAAAWLSAYLGGDCRLVRMDDDAPRPVSEKHGRPGDIVSFADGFPLLITTTASLDALDLAGAGVTMRRFRPNIVLAGATPFAEDTWKRIRIGDVELDLVKACARCVVTTIDQDSGEKPSREPVATLAKKRKGTKGVYFGQNAIPRSLGRIETGAAVTVLERRAEPYEELAPAALQG